MIERIFLTIKLCCNSRSQKIEQSNLSIVSSPGISYFQWGNSQVFIFFRSKVIEKTVTRKAFLMGPLRYRSNNGVTKYPGDQNFGTKSSPRPSHGRKKRPCGVWLHWRLRVQMNKEQTNKHYFPTTRMQKIFFHESVTNSSHPSGIVTVRPIGMKILVKLELLYILRQ